MKKLVYALFGFLFIPSWAQVDGDATKPTLNLNSGSSSGRSSNTQIQFNVGQLVTGYNDFSYRFSYGALQNYVKPTEISVSDLGNYSVQVGSRLEVVILPDPGTTPNISISTDPAPNGTLSYTPSTGLLLFIPDASDVNSITVTFSIDNEGVITEKVITLSAFAAPVPVSGEVFGFTEGSHSISESGSFNYMIPLALPMGAGEMKPDISLQYSSHGSDGIMGMGWTLGGLSTIGLSPESIDPDGRIRGVSYELVDPSPLNLDGTRLVQVGGTDYRSNGAEYRMESTDFSKIIEERSGTSESFKRYTKDGLIYEYGFGNNSQIKTPDNKTLFWAVNKISDTKGNYIEFFYQANTTTNTIEYYPTEIRYGANEIAGTPHTARVEFVYDNRPDPRSEYLNGVQILKNKRLRSIRVFNNNNLLRRYDITYLPLSETSFYSKVDQIREIGSDGKSFRPTQFIWTDNQTAGFDAGSQLISLTDDVKGKRLFPLDVNGDGLQDILLFDEKTNQNILYEFDGTNYTKVSSAFPTLTGEGRFYGGDFNADGIGDLVWFVEGDATNSRFLINTKNASLNPALNFSSFSFTADDQVYFSDVNGDAYTDILFYNKKTSVARWFLNQTTGTSITFGSASLAGDNEIPAGADLYVNDYTGDGLADILAVNDSTGISRLFSNQSLGNATTSVTYLALENPISSALKDSVQIYQGNWNGDNLVDFLIVDKKTGNNTFLINKGGGAFDGGGSIAGNVSTNVGTKVNLLLPTYFKGDSTIVYPVDFNADGATDIVTYNYFSGVTTFLQNRGNLSFTQTDNYTIDANQVIKGSGLIFGDWEGRGILSPLWYDEKTGDNFLYRNTQLNDNQVIAVETGNGQRIEVNYATLRDPEVYTMGTAATYPEIDYQGALNVVKSCAMKNGIGGTSSFQYEYANGKMNVRGRGFRGFEKVIIKDLQTDIHSATIYQRDFRQVGHEAIRRTQYTATGDTLSVAEYENAYTEGTTAGVYFSYVAEETDRQYELDGTLMTSSTKTMEYDAFGNVTLLRVEYSDGHVDETISTYENLTSGTIWLLGRLKTVDFRRKTPTTSFTSRKAAFTYDPVSGLLTEEVTEPENDSLRITTTHVYDDFGNKIETHTTAFNGTSDETRSSFVTYDASGRYAIENSNALGHTEQRSYNNTWGYVTVMTGPNELSTRWEYDGFGRKVFEQRADGTIMQKSYRWCDGNCPTNGSYYTVTQTSGLPTTYVYYDMLGREIESAKEGFNGTVVKTSTIYDAKGNVAQKSDPYYEGSAPAWTILEYDLKNRPVQITEAGDRVSTIEYEGLTQISVNPEGQTEVQVMDQLGRIVSIQDNLGSVMTYTYDNFGNLIQTTDPLGNEIHWTYDNLGRLIRLDDPDIGLEKYHFNAFGELIKKINARSQETTYAYDVLGRLTERNEEEGQTLFTYDEGSKAIGKVSSVITPVVTTSISYDDLGRLETKTKLIDDLALSSTMEYDQFSRLFKMAYPSGFEVRNNYNERGYLFEVYGGDSLVWQLDQVTARGQVSEQTFGNGVNTRSFFDENTGWLDQIRSFLGADSIQFLSYSYDNLGNLTSRQDDIRGLREDFEYDGINRLLNAILVDRDTLSMTYDAIGNLTYKSDIGTYSYGADGAGPHAVSSINGENVENWSLAAALAQYMTFTSFQKVSQIENDTAGIYISYDESYQRIKVEKKVKGQPFETKVYFDNIYERIEKEGQVIEVHYIRGATGVVAVRRIIDDTQASTSYWHKDHLGSLETVTDKAGTVVASLSYDAWGRRRNADTWESYDHSVDNYLSRGFTGHEHYDLLGLIDMNGRIYDPVLGRFTTPDPFIQSPYNIQSFNRYSYVLNNPLSYTDPSGYIFKSIGKIFSGIAKGVGSIVKGAGDLVFNAAKEVGRFYEKHKDVIVPIVAGLVTGGVLGPVIASSLGVSSAIGAAAGFGFGRGVSSAIRSGASLGQALEAGVKSAVITGVTAGATNFVGDQLLHETGLGNVVEKALAHGSVQGLSAELQGGEFGTGFVSGAFSSASQLGIKNIESGAGQLAATVMVGGTASVIAGGKFENGAISGATILIYNDWGENIGKVWKGFWDDNEALRQEGFDGLKEDYANTPAKHKVLAGAGLAVAGLAVAPAAIPAFATFSTAAGLKAAGMYVAGTGMAAAGGALIGDGVSQKIENIFDKFSVE